MRAQDLQAQDFQAQDFQAQDLQVQDLQVQDFQTQEFQTQGFQTQGFQTQDFQVQDFSGINLDRIIAEINYDINLLYVVPCVYTRNIILNHLRDRIFMLESVLKAMNQQVHSQPQTMPLQPQPFPLQPQLLPHQPQPLPLQPQPLPLQPQPLPLQPQPFPPQPQRLPLQPEVAPIVEQPPAQQPPTIPENQTTFTLQELSRFDGKGGNLAYVAVNGFVYDVTNNAAWAAATHFGMTAGKDLTNEFASCHAGQPILSKLKLVGKLV